MSNELVVYVNDEVSTFQNKELEQSVRKIKSYSDSLRFHSNQVSKFTFAIALELKHIKDNELYKEDGYSNIEEFARKVLNCGKATTYSLLKVADNFLISGEEDRVGTIFAREDRDFSFNQLRELITLDVGKIEELVKSEKLYPEMTIKQVRQVRQAVQSELLKEEDEEIESSSDVGTEEKEGINSDITADSISSSFIEEHELKLESTENSSRVSDYQDTSETPSEGLQSFSDSSYQPISKSDIDFMIAQLAGDEESKEEEYPLSPYELTFFNCRSEQSESKKVEDIELSELVYSDIVGRLPSELKDYIELMKKEICRLNHFSNLKSARLEELSGEVERLKEENYRLAHPVKRGRGRPRKNQ